MDKRIPRPRADGRGAISEEVRYLRGEVARLRRLVPGGASGNTPLGSPIGGRDFGGEAAVDASQSDGSFSVVSRADREILQRGCLSLQVQERFPGCERWLNMGLQLRGALCLGRSVRLSVTRLEPLFFEDFEANTMDLLPEIKFSASRLWLVFRDHFGDRLTKVGHQLGDSLFVGLPSEREARLVCSRAGVP